MSVTTAENESANQTETEENNEEVAKAQAALERQGELLALAEELRKWVTVEVWTVEDAQKALAKNQVNRQQRRNSIDEYRRKMENGMWADLCATPLVFDEDGNLINGQHRLIAQVEAGIPMVWIVIRNYPAKDEASFDSGIARAARDLLHRKGEDNSGLLAAIARLVFHIQNDSLSGSRFKVSNEEIMQTVMENPSLRRSTEMAALSKNGMTPIAPSVLGAAHWLIRQNNSAAEADGFIYRVSTLTGEDEGSPVLALARRMNELKRARTRVHARDLLAVTIKAWNYDVQGRTAVKLNVQSKTGEYKTPVALTREVAFPEREDD